MRTPQEPNKTVVKTTKKEDKSVPDPKCRLKKVQKEQEDEEKKKMKTTTIFQFILIKLYKEPHTQTSTLRSNGLR